VDGGLDLVVLVVKKVCLQPLRQPLTQDAILQEHLLPLPRLPLGLQLSPPRSLPQPLALLLGPLPPSLGFPQPPLEVPPRSILEGFLVHRLENLLLKVAQLRVEMCAICVLGWVLRGNCLDGLFGGLGDGGLDGDLDSLVSRRFLHKGQLPLVGSAVRVPVLFTFAWGLPA
jgi:hypothetical protein